jgi:hypothetical protein
MMALSALPQLSVVNSPLRSGWSMAEVTSLRWLVAVVTVIVVEVVDTGLLTLVGRL